MIKKPSKRRQSSASRKQRPAASRPALRRGTVDVLSDPGLVRQIAKSRAFYAAGGKGLSFEDVFGEPMRPARRDRR